jgi:hypothetical protein
MSELLRMRVRYFSDGMVLGSREYLNGFYERQREYFPEKRKAVFAKPKGADWGENAQTNSEEVAIGFIVRILGDRFGLNDI